MENKSRRFHRRELLRSGAAAAGALCLPNGPHGLKAAARSPDAQTTFRHRGYLGWITDLASEPDTHAQWPSMRLDERLLNDYRQSFDLMAKLGFNEISIWGLYVANAWPADIKDCVTPERGRLVNALIEEAHRRNIKVLSGLGVYSWGFEEIIKADPEVARTSPLAMCASEPKAWDWMAKVIDFVVSRFPIDGVSMQSADQGRCECPRCKEYSTAEYHAVLNVRVAEYIRARWPGKIVGVNSWGMPLGDEASLPSLQRIGKVADYLIDARGTSRWEAPGLRRETISSLACDFGTIGGPQPEPPQHWPRDRWFLPTLRRTGEHLTALAADGGRACEYFFHILANPGDEVSFRLAGRMLSAPHVSWETHALAAVEEMFKVKNRRVCDALMSLMFRCEEAYFRHLPPDVSGMISLEPLVSNRPGPPIYLTERLNPSQRETYAAELDAVAPQYKRLLPEVGRADKVRRILACLRNVMDDLQA